MAAFQLIRDAKVESVDALVTEGGVSLTPDVLRASLGWELKAEGLCQGDLCVPIRDQSKLQSDTGIDLAAFAQAVGLPLALDIAECSAAIGTSAAGRAASLQSLEAPDFSLPDITGKLHSLSEHRGKKVLLIAYASW